MERRGCAQGRELGEVPLTRSYTCLFPSPTTGLPLLCSPPIWGVCNQGADKDVRWWRGQEFLQASQSPLDPPPWRYLKRTIPGSEDKGELFQLLPGASPGPCLLVSPRLFTTLAHWLASRSSHGFPKVLHGKWQKSVDYTQEKTPRILCGPSSLSQSQQTHPQIKTYLGKGNYISRPFIGLLSTSQLLALFTHLFP